MAWTEEMRAKSRETIARKKREAAEAKLARVAAPEEPVPELMPGLGDAPQDDFADEMPVSEPPEVGMTDPFERFLADLDPETRELLTDGDGSTLQLRAIYEAEVKKAKEARREVAKKQAAARASRHAKTDAGLISPQDMAASDLARSMNRKVSWVVEMARDANGYLLDEGYRVDGELLYHGRQVTGTYAQWLSYRRQLWLAKQHELDFEGKGIVNEQRRLSTGALDVKLNLNGASA